jgi:FkbM family methyltransferase
MALFGTNLRTYLSRFRAGLTPKFSDNNSVFSKLYVDNLFSGCDLYQNLDDILNYSVYSNLSLKECRRLDPEIDFMVDNTREGDLVVDIGANIGFFTLALSSLVGTNGRVLSFEPGPVSFALLSRNVLSNVINNRIPNNVDLIDKAVSDTDGVVNLFLCPTGESDNQLHDADSYFFDREPEESRIKWPSNSVCLDSFLSSSDIEKLTYIKIDTQGHEYYVLKGMRKVLSQNRKISMTVEYAPYLKAWEKYTPLDFFTLVESLGLSIYDIKDPLKSVGYDYLIREYGHLDTQKMTTLILRFQL